MLNKYGYPKIETVEQYWEEHKKWKKKFNEINSFKQLRKDPFGYYEKLKDILEEGYKRELITKEYYQNKINEVAREIDSPNRFQGDIRKGKQYIRNKAKKYFGKK